MDKRAVTAGPAGGSAAPRGWTGGRLLAALVAAACLLAVFLRVYFYAVNRSLWLDEAFLAVNITSRSFSGLLGPLDYNQAAPVGFLFLVKAAAGLFGYREPALRLVPLVAGLASVPLMWLVARRFVGRVAGLAALALFAVSPWLVYYASELKPYSTDVAVTLALLLLATACLAERARPRAFVLFGAVGAVAAWFSYGGLFVFLGALATIGLALAVRRDGARLAWLAGAGAAWAASLVALYLLNMTHLWANPEITGQWDGRLAPGQPWGSSFAPGPPWAAPGWYGRVLFEMLREPARLPASVLTVGLLVAGAVSLAARRWQFLLLLVAPPALALGAAALHRYPFYGRLLLFLVPVLLLLLFEGISRLRRLARRAREPWPSLLAAALFAWVAIGPAASTGKALFFPPLREHIRPVLAHVRDNRRPGDRTCVYYGAGPAFRYYAPRYGFDPADCVVGTWDARGDTARLGADIERIRAGGRTWVVFSHNHAQDGLDEQEFFLRRLADIEVEAGRFRAEGAAAYLYDAGPRIVQHQDTGNTRRTTTEPQSRMRVEDKGPRNLTLRHQEHQGRFEISD